jgi:N-acetyl-anhydromuramyl-L-alanine amidase AmpD
VLGHSDVAPRRKIDPGEKFPWRALARSGVGYWPVSKRTGAALDTAATQRALAGFGYEIEATGGMDAQTRAVVAAFQRHFRPRRVDGKIDAATAALAQALTRASRQPT